MSLIPIEDHIVVEALEAEKVTASGIILPTDSKEKPSMGTVIAVGMGKMLDNGSRSPMDVAVGDTVYFTKYSPDELEVDGKKYLIVKHSSILAKKSS